MLSEALDYLELKLFHKIHKDFVLIIEAKYRSKIIKVFDEEGWMYAMGVGSSWDECIKDLFLNLKKQS